MLWLSASTEQESVEIRYYSIIYHLIDEVKSALSGMLEPERIEDILGIADVRDVFRSPKFGQVAGCMVIEGTVYRNKPIRVLRENVVIFEGELESLRRYKDDVNEVRNGTECGIGVKNYDVKVGDQIEVFDVCWRWRGSFGSFNGGCNLSGFTAQAAAKL